MYFEKTIGIIVSTYNEEKLINQTLASIPSFVDKIIVVDDKSQDRTVEMVKSQATIDSRIILIQHKKNQGFGAVTITGYRQIMEMGIDIAVNLNGDGQMDVSSLNRLLLPVIHGVADVAKGNRLSYPEAHHTIPLIRFIGISFLSFLTRIATGYWHISDSQHTYHAISLPALRKLRLDRLYKRFGYPNDFLIECAIQGLRILDIPVKPIYDIGEKSELKPFRVWPRILWILTKGFFWKKLYAIQ